MKLPHVGGQRPRDAASVLAYAERASRTGQNFGVGWCQQFVRTAYGASAGAPTAAAAWQAAAYKHAGDTAPPPGVAVYWTGGAGHAAISAGNGMVYSTDVKRPGKIDLVSIDWINQHWGKHYEGWAEDTNGKRVTKFNAKPVDPSLAPEMGGGTSTKAGGGVATTADAKMLAEDYGYAAAFYNSSPELKKLIGNAVKGQWSPQMFAARLQGTKWYKTHSTAEREWTALSTGDKAEADSRRAQRRGELIQQYRTMGVAIPPKRLDQIVESSLKYGWTPDQQNDALASEFHYKAGNTVGGVAGKTVADLRQMASDYVVPLSDGTLEKWTSNVLRGEADPESFKTYLQAQAKSLFPQLAASIDSGMSVKDYLNPYQETAAQILGINASEVNWSDPKWQQGVFAVKDGQRTVPSLADWQTTLRTDKKFGYENSQNGKRDAADLMTELARTFGKGN